MMDPEGKKFGRGPRELTGAVDLLNHYKLWAHHDLFCKRSLPFLISETHYLHNVVGDTEIRKGEGMELDQLFKVASYARESYAHIQPFDLDALRQAFRLRESTPIDLPSAEKGIPTVGGKRKSESKDKERKHKDRDKEKDSDHRKHKQRQKDRINDKDREKDRSGNYDAGADHSRKHHEKACSLWKLLFFAFNTYLFGFQCLGLLLLLSFSCFRRGSMMAMKILVIFKETREVRIRARGLMK